MCEFKEIWTEISFYDQPLSIWMGNQDLIDLSSENLKSLDVFTASSIGSYHYVKEILSRGFHPDSKNKNHFTALMYAVWYCQEAVISLLLETGASIHVCNAKGQNVLMMAARSGYDKLVECFLKYGSLVEARDINDFTALLHAAYLDQLEVVEILLKHQANPNAFVRFSGRSPLMFAAMNGNLNMVELLLNAGAFPNFFDISGQDAEHLAMEAGHSHVASILKQRKLEGSSLLEGPVAMESRLSNSYFKSRIRPSRTNLAPDLDTFLKQFGLESYIPHFREQEVDFYVFLTLTDKDLKDCGVTKLGPRRKMMEAISRWNDHAPRPTGLEGAYMLKLVVEMEQLKTQMQSTNAEMNKRKEECHDLCKIAKEHLASVSKHMYPLTDLTYHILKVISVVTDCLDGIQSIFTRDTK